MKKLKKIIFRIRNGYPISDLWSLDYALAKLILPRLIQFKKHSIMSYPMDFKSTKEWHKCIDKMIWSMDYIANDREMEYNLSDHNKNEKKCQKGLELFSKHFQSLWD